MRRVILARLAPLVERLGSTSSYRVVGRGRRWALLWVRFDDPHIRAEEWERRPGE